MDSASVSKAISTNHMASATSVSTKTKTTTPPNGVITFSTNPAILMDMFDIPALCAAIIDKLAVECFRLDFEVPCPSLIIFMMENIPRFYPIHTLMAIAVARVLWHNSEPLETLPYGFGVRVQKNLDKPYGLCDTCYEQSKDGKIPDNCSHFCNQPTDFDPSRYQEDNTTDHGLENRH